jgi:hypothetical protein
MNEALLMTLQQPWDRMRVDYALRELQSWYLGDGTYGDGPHFHWDFYNSFVIQPYLLQLMDLSLTNHQPGPPCAHQSTSAPNAAAIRALIADGSTRNRPLHHTRCGAPPPFDAARLASRRSATTTRCALSAIIGEPLAQPAFSDGWPRSSAGHQPASANHISTGSLYLCSAAWLPLGLPPADPFWSQPPHPWTSQTIWSGNNLQADHAHDE